MLKGKYQTLVVIMDYKEYITLKEIKMDRLDYYSAFKTKMHNKKWIKHEDLKRYLGLSD